tara:strand:- start:5547 stop:6380 length:834 start_codon:yes stop_codon:yes gene_type:complete
MQSFNHNKSRDLGDILTDTFQYVRIYYPTLGKGLLFFVLPLYIVQAFLLQGYSDQIMSSIFQPNDFSMFETFFSARYILSIFLSMVAYAMLTIVALKHMQLTNADEIPDPSDLLDGVLPLLIKLAILYIILFFIIILSAFFFFFPALFFGIRLSLAPTSLVLENLSIGKSISRSWELTEGFWWATFALFVIMYIIVIFSSYAFILPATILSIFFVDTGTVTDANLFSTIITSFMTLSTAFASLFVVILHLSFGLQFFNIVERKEGGGLRSKIEGLID